MSTLPLKASINGWNESIRIHSHRFSRRISSILWLLTKCNTQQALAKYFDNFLRDMRESRSAVENALLGTKGKRYLQEIFCFDRKRSLVVAEPKQLLALVDAILGFAGNSFYLDTSDYALCNKMLLKVFDYDAFRDGKVIKCKRESGNVKISWGSDNSVEQWNSAALIRKIGIRYCPYCNAETIYVVPKEDGTESECYRSALDHYLPRSRYPFFGLSLYNLIPACTRCNSCYKHEQDPLSLLCGTGVLSKQGDVEIYRVAHPYLEDIYSKFSVRFIIKDSKLKLQCKVNGADRRIATYLEDMFKWSTTYTTLFMPEAKSVVDNIRKIRPMFWGMLDKSFRQTPRISLSKLICGFEFVQDEFMNYRLGKMKMDIFKKYCHKTV